jgi:hypothetical protein
MSSVPAQQPLGNEPQSTQQSPDPVVEQNEPLEKKRKLDEVVTVKKEEKEEKEEGELGEEEEDEESDTVRTPIRLESYIEDDNDKKFVAGSDEEDEIVDNTDPYVEVDPSNIIEGKRTRRKRHFDDMVPIHEGELVDADESDEGDEGDDTDYEEIQIRASDLLEQADSDYYCEGEEEGDDYDDDDDDDDDDDEI